MTERITPHLYSSLHEPACTAGFPACGFTGLSSPVDQERATGKPPEPAGSKACATNPPRFTVPMRATYGVETTHEPAGSGTGVPPVRSATRARRPRHYFAAQVHGSDRRQK